MLSSTAAVHWHNLEVQKNFNFIYFNYHQMKNKFAVMVLILPLFTTAQNVGVGTSSPAEKLDVNGNINVTGTIKVNGTDGVAGQALMKNSAGTFSWENIFPYNNVAGFRAGSTTTDNTVYTWTIPANVTKIYVEVWGAGGGGASGGGGGGGGYAACQWTVSAGATVNITVGGGGAGAVTAGVDATDGNSSSITINSLQVVAYGGDGGHSSIGGYPGRYASNSLALMVFGQAGLPGESNTETYGQYNTTVFYTAIKYGVGGQGGNTLREQKNGGFSAINNSTAALIKNIYSNAGGEPAGGGGGDYFGGKSGGPGMVVIHY